MFIVQYIDYTIESGELNIHDFGHYQGRHKFARQVMRLFTMSWAEPDKRPIV